MTKPKINPENLLKEMGTGSAYFAKKTIVDDDNDDRTDGAYGTDSTPPTNPPAPSSPLPTTPNVGMLEQLRKEQEARKVSKDMRVRVPFELYEHHIEDMEYIVDKLGRRGIKMSKSRLVRDALDEHINKYKKELGLNI